LSRSNSMSKIAEEGTLMKRKIENALHNIKNSQTKKPEEVDINSPLIRDQEVSFDDETVLLVNLDSDCTEGSIDSKRDRIENTVGASLITSN